MTPSGGEIGGVADCWVGVLNLGHGGERWWVVRILCISGLFIL